MTLVTNSVYRYTESGQRYIPGFTSFGTDYLNEITYKYDIKTNRLYDEPHSLPISQDSIKMQINEVVTSETINDKIEQLYKNYLYLLTRTKIAKADAVTEYRGPVGITDQIYTQPVTGAYRTEYEQMLQHVLTGENMLSDVTSISLAEHIQYGVDSLVLTTPKKIKLFKFKQLIQDGVNCVVKVISDAGTENLVDSNSDLTFENVVDCVMNTKGHGYVLDAGVNIVYKYNMRGLTVDDRVLLSKQTTGRLLLSKLGGVGVVSDKIRFESPLCMYYAHDYLFVLDKNSNSSQYWVKMYDSQLNWLDSFNLSLSFTRDTPIKIVMDVNKQLYILTDTGKLYQFSLQQLLLGSYAPQAIHDLAIVDFDLNPSEQYVDINLSTINTNLMYIVTNKSIYKKYMDKMSSNIGKIDWDRLNIGSGNVVPQMVAINDHHAKLGDVMLILGTDISSSGNHNLLYNCNDEENIISMLDDVYETRLFKLQDVYIKPGEYISAFVYNKMLSKMYYNLRSIIDNIKFIASVEMDDHGKSLYPGVRYISREETSKYDINPTPQDYIGVNELVCTGTINRSLLRVLKKQQDIMQMLQDRTNDQEFFNTTTMHLKRTPVPYIEHKLPTQATHRLQKLT